MVKECVYNNEVFAYKSFYDSRYIKGKKLKLSELSEVQNPYLYTPMFWVRKGNDTNQYLSKYCYGKDIDAFKDYDIIHKIKVLKSAKNAILSMHDNGIIHCDLIGSNILVENDEARIIDFDNATYKNFKTNAIQINDLSKDFINIFGIIPEADIYTFNLLTFSIINDCDLYMARNYIQNEYYKYIDNKAAIKICKGMSFSNVVPCKDFLIDAIDDSKFKI